jgi:hypothetical protein
LWRRTRMPSRLSRACAASVPRAGSSRMENVFYVAELGINAIARCQCRNLAVWVTFRLPGTLTVLRFHRTVRGSSALFLGLERAQRGGDIPKS